MSGRRERGSTEEPMRPNGFVDLELGRLRGRRYSPRGVAAFLAAMWARSRATAAARPRLVRELLVATVTGAAVAAGVGALLTLDGVPTAAALAAPIAAWLLLCGWVYLELGLVRHPVTDVDVAAIGPANMLSLYRGWAAVPLALVAVYHPQVSATAIGLAVTAGLTDLVDGPVAVRRRQETRLGRLLDPVVDAFLFSAVGLVLWRWGLLPAWVAVLVAVRYFAVVLVGILLLFARGRSLPVRHTPWGQRSTMAIALSLLLTLLAPYLSIPFAVLLGVYGLTALTMLLALVAIALQAPLSAGDG